MGVLLEDALAGGEEGLGPSVGSVAGGYFGADVEVFGLELVGGFEGFIDFENFASLSDKISAVMGGVLAFSGLAEFFLFYF